jgi:flagellar motility protein MotE (MotC chaperone)
MRLRLLPVLIFSAVLLLSVRVGSLWNDLSVEVGGVSVAEIKPAAGPAPKPAAPPAAKPGRPPAAKPGTPPAGKAAAAAGQEKTVAAITEPHRRPPPERDVDEYDLRVLQDLVRRREVLDKRERTIALREGLLKAAEKRVEQKIAQLTKIQVALKADLAKAQNGRKARYAKLIKIYSNMKPKDAARVFDEMPLTILLDIVGGMKEGVSAPVLAAMNSDKARQVTAGLAARARRGRAMAAPKK